MASEVLTRKEFNSRINSLEREIKDLKKLLVRPKPASDTLTRQEIIDNLGIDSYMEGVRRGYLNPIQKPFNGTRAQHNNSKIRIDRKEYETWKKILKK